MCAVGHACISLEDDAFNLVAPCPLHIARIPLDSPHVLAHFWLNGLQHEVVNGVKRIREYELGPRKDTQLIA